MEKLKLDLQNLKVDTFETGNKKNYSGTVKGNLKEYPPLSVEAPCVTLGEPTCRLSDCEDSCFLESCDGRTCEAQLTCGKCPETTILC